ncbi:MAG: sialate O-acetylesterase [Clostridiales bacterium]|nr:sialate O-acetylesterase [Clostridiales bacterium]
MLQSAVIFQDGMILQRNKPVPVWGTHTKGAVVTAEIQGQCAETTVDDNGDWQLVLPALSASESEQLIIRSGDEQFICRDVAVGEVWVAGGQSNMEFHMRYEKHLQDALKDCPNSRIRFFDVPEVSYDGQLEQFDYSRYNVWRYASAEDLEYFCAVGYYFEKAICEDLDVPVGIIGCNWGGTVACAWMNPETVRTCGLPWMQDYAKRISTMDMDEYWKKQYGNPMNNKGNLFDPFSEFIMPRTPSKEEIEKFFSQMQVDLSTINELYSEMQPTEIPGCLYEHMLKTIAPYAVRGFLWYQGESDDVPGKNILYKDMLTGLIADWRTLWNDDTLPFLIVQLPGYEKWLWNTEENHYPVIRECQQQVADTVKNAYLCSISDVGEQNDIHPKDKKTVGERLALLARGHVYKEAVFCDAPRAVSARKNGAEVDITFRNADGGLYVTGNTIEALKLYVAEAEELPYTFRIEDNQLVLMLPEIVTDRIQIKFAQTSWFTVNVYNKAGIPAVPFEIEC